MLKKAQKTGNAWTVKIGEGSGPQGSLPKSRSKSGSGPRGPLPGSTTFSNFDGPGVTCFDKTKSDLQLYFSV